MEQNSQDLYIERYLSGQALPAAPRWMKELMDDPELEAAEDLLDSIVPSSRYVWSNEPPPLVLQNVPRADTPRRNVWKIVSDIAFCAALIAIAIGAVVFGGVSGQNVLLFGLSYLVILVSIALRIFLVEHNYKRKAELHGKNGF